MRQNYLFLCIALLGFYTIQAQTFEVEAIQNNGNSDKLINIVILADGYTAAEQNAFISKAQGLSNYLFTQTPWANYKNYFNIHAIKVISNESGAKHDNTSSDCSLASPLVPVSNPDNYFGSRFDNYGIHRLIIATNTTRIVNVLAANFPNYDVVIVIANTPYYGGSGGTYGTITANSSANEILAHEIGHTFGSLADEYYAGDNYFEEQINMTQQSDPAQIKWKNWLNSDEGIGIHNYCCGGNSGLWFRPTQLSCKMEQLGRPYCAVCKEGIIEKIHSLINPILNYTPTTSTINSTDQFIDFNLTELLKPIPNTLEISWQLDGVILDNNLEMLQLDQTSLPVGIHTLTASVTDASEYVRTDNHASLHVNSVTWTIDRSALGISLTSSKNKMAFTVFPNPSADIVNFVIDMDKDSTLSVEVMTADGKIVQQSATQKISKGKYQDTLQLQNLASGTYIIAFKLNGTVYPKTIVKR